MFHILNMYSFPSSSSTMKEKFPSKGFMEKSMMEAKRNCNVDIISQAFPHHDWQNTILVFFHKNFNQNRF